MAIIEHKMSPALAARVMSVSDLAGWGLSMVAYVRWIAAGEWAICSADGTRIGTAPDRLSAFAAIRQHDLEPLSVH
ncbi:DUF1150 family protein [Magnetospirillum molischianum]|uniref:DUF1150 family protein n=1 Tax=Magnetospirillum molischianum DSM 120 TaxID=1150626 RepID=H8FTU9_MAGML|nr:DUF1150 family protein [Magnetospirillum molischianum]CCG41806.1 conserved hypothetical protein [Magnetospirillum molischianum DSM 120]